MLKLSTKIAISFVISGLFIVVSFMAVDYFYLDSTIYLILFLLFCYMLFFGIAMGRNYVRPVKTLIKNANEISRGNLTHKFSVHDKDEMGELAKQFNDIVEHFAKSQTETELMKNSADLKFKTKELISQQVIHALEQKIRNRTTDLDNALAQIEQLTSQLAENNAQINDLKKQLTQVGAKKKKVTVP